jgi:hypothetical protein
MTTSEQPLDKGKKKKTILIVALIAIVAIVIIAAIVLLITSPSMGHKLTITEVTQVGSTYTVNYTLTNPGTRSWIYDIDAFKVVFSDGAVMPVNHYTNHLEEIPSHYDGWGVIDCQYSNSGASVTGLIYDDGVVNLGRICDCLSSSLRT